MGKSNHQGPTDIAHAELTIEFKWHTSDIPFGPPTLTGEGKDKACSFLCDSKASVHTTGQITMYVATQLGSQLGSQLCVCVYSVLIVGSYARLIQWDRTGAVISEPITYNEE